MSWEVLGHFALLITLTGYTIRLIHQAIQMCRAVMHFCVRLEEKLDVLLVAIDDCIAIINVLIEKK